MEHEIAISRVDYRRRAWARPRLRAGAGPDGHAVAVTARSADELTETVTLIEQAGGRGLALPADVTDQRAVTAVVAAVESQLGPIDVLINNAGIFQALGEIGQVDPTAWWREVEVNLRGPYLCAHTVLPSMIARRSGRIINVVSEAGTVGIGFVSAYGVSKTALIRLTETLADETRPYGITVLAAHPGTVRTPMSEYVRTSPHVAELAQPVQAWFEHLFEAQLDTPIAQAVAFMVALAEGRADALSGCYLDVDADLAALTAQAAAIQAEKRYTLRLQA